MVCLGSIVWGKGVGGGRTGEVVSSPEEEEAVRGGVVIETGIVL